MQIRFENLRKWYSGKGGEIRAVDGISIEIPENEIFGIIGKSGAGKSSLVRLISLLEAPDDGKIFYGDERVDNLGKRELILRRRKIGMIFQNFNLFSSRTAGKNVAYPMEIAGFGKDEIRRRVREMLDLVGLSDREDAPISTLSGGQKQRVAIARALSTRPGILFCDEATSALDPQTTKSILNLIRDIQKRMNLTVVMITHQMEVVRDICDRVAVIDNGKIVELSSVRELFRSPKADITKEFLANLTRQDDGADFVQWARQRGNYTLRFMGEATGRPVLSELLRKFDIGMNILGAGIQRLPDGEIGTMNATISGSEDEIGRAREFLRQNGVILSTDAENSGIGESEKE